MAYGGKYVPPQYEEVVAEHSSLGGLLTYVDFIPLCLENPVFGLPKFEPFPVLIERANEFLCKHSEWETKTCESIEFKCKSSAKVQSEKMTYYEPGENGGRVIYIRGLRLWLVPRITQYPQQLGYINIIPRVLNSSGLSWPDFQSLNETLQECNENIRHNPNLIPGKIITVETQEMKTRTADSLNPDKSCWNEIGGGPKRYIVVMRVFYEKYIDTMDSREEIGIADFKPTMIDKGKLYHKPNFEPFSNVIQAASQWCSQQRTIRYCNAQTFEVKMKSGYVVDTQRMSYMERAKATTYYVRILRLAFVSLTQDRIAPALNLTCKNFSPLLVNMKTFSCSEYESLSKTRDRIQEWLRVTGGKVLSCETTAMRLRSGGERTHGLETSLTFNRAKTGEYWINVIRVFLDGYYPEPPDEVLSPRPQVQNESCLLL